MPRDFASVPDVLAYDTLEEAIALQNAVSKGVSSAIFNTDLREAETFLSTAGSDCRIANTVNYSNSLPLAQGVRFDV